MPIEIRRFGVGHRRPDGPPGTTGRDRPGHPRRRARRSSPSSRSPAARGSSRTPTRTRPGSIVIEGGGWVGVGDERTRVAAGEAVLWPADIPHAAWTEHSEMRAFVVEFAGADDAAMEGIVRGSRRARPGRRSGRARPMAPSGRTRSRASPRRPGGRRAGLSGGAAPPTDPPPEPCRAAQLVHRGESVEQVEEPWTSSVAAGAVLLRSATSATSRGPAARSTGCRARTSAVAATMASNRKVGVARLERSGEVGSFGPRARASSAAPRRVRSSAAGRWPGVAGGRRPRAAGGRTAR